MGEEYKRVCTIENFIHKEGNSSIEEWQLTTASVFAVLFGSFYRTTILTPIVLRLNTQGFHSFITDVITYSL